ncbi:MAG: hypothetical protein ACI93R_000550 [Flavobacteriales bacterium]|jgi:hypothetical protein
MYHSILTFVSLLLCSLCLYVSFRFLKQFDWVLAWIRGTVGLICLGITAFILFSALDLSSYEELMSEKTVATLTFEKVDDQLYNVEVDYIFEGLIKKYEIYGDQWQMDARIVRWTGLLAALGAKPGYRLDRLSGRYYSLEDERRSKRSAHQIKTSEYGFDVWAYLQTSGTYVPLIDAVYGSATYLPMSDGAIYQVALSHKGLIAAPVNDAAKLSVKNWR